MKTALIAAAMFAVSFLYGFGRGVWRHRDEYRFAIAVWRTRLTGKPTPVRIGGRPMTMRLVPDEPDDGDPDAVA